VEEVEGLSGSSELRLLVLFTVHYHCVLMSALLLFSGDAVYVPCCYLSFLAIFY
jgi:hypothetical protein